jgi:hypothetical protein
MKRGTFGFDVNAGSDLQDNAENVERLRRLWLDRSMIDGRDLGPGNSGDFDHGAWHVACHVVAAGGARRAADGRMLWLELSHDSRTDTYFASVTATEGGGPETRRLDSAEGRALVEGSTLLGFVEGNSVGHISARGARDPSDRFNGWTRQQFDESASSGRDGGKVWEHWCTVRDIRPAHRIGTSVLKAYVSLMAALGDKFVPTVTRGRRSYGHPTQLCAMVRSGLTSENAALWDVTPDRIPDAAERKLLEATPGDALAAVSALNWSDPPRYYMFARRIGSWSRAAQVREDLREFVVEPI